MPEQIKLHEWLVIFLVYADLRKDKEKIEREFENLRQDIINCQLNVSSKIVMVYNRVFVKEDKLIDKTFVFEIVNYGVGTKRNDFKLVKPYFDRDITKEKKRLAEVFKFIDQKYASKKRLLITWDHGSIFGMFKEAKHVRESSIKDTFNLEKVKETNDYILWIKRNKPLKYKRKKTILSRWFTLKDESTEFREILTNEELSSSIQNGFSNRKVDVVIMMNCHMQNVLTQFALKGCVDFLVASEGIINEPGYNYPEILKRIMDAEEISPENLARVSVSSIINNHRGKQEFKNNIDEWAVFAIKLIDIGLLGEYINSLSFILGKVLSLRPSETWGLIHDQRIRMFYFDQELSRYMIDLRTCVSFLAMDIPAIEKNELVTKLEDVIKKLQIEKHIGTRVYYYGGQDYSNNLEPCGFAIYFPEDQISAISDLDTFPEFVSEKAKRRSKFFKETKWYLFLKKYLKL